MDCLGYHQVSDPFYLSEISLMRYIKNVSWLKFLFFAPDPKEFKKIPFQREKEMLEQSFC